MMAEKFSSFPVPFPDETYFSLLSRYHLFYGATSGGETLRQLTGHRGAVPTNGIPSGLNYLAAQFPSGYPATAEDLLERNTLWPYFRPFLDLKGAAKVERGMLEDRTSHAGAQAGVLASRVGCAWVPKFCGACADEDQEHYGVAYWHRAHQLPGVLACHRHAVVLKSIRHDPAHPHRHALYLPPLQVEQNDPLIPGPRQFLRAQPVLMLIASLSVKLLKACLPPLDPMAVQRAYRSGLAEKGLMTQHGRIRGAQLRAQFEPTRRLLSHLPDYQFLNHPSAAGWLVRFAHDRSAFGHPLKHLVFIAWLYGSLDRFLEAMQKPVSSADQSRHKITGTAIDWSKRLPDLLERRHLSLRKAAEVLGVSVNTVRTHAEQLGITMHRRPKRITQQLEEEMAQAFRDFVPPREIATRLGISLVSVYRFSCSHPDYRKVERAEYIKGRLTTSRSHLVAAIDANPGSHRSAIRRLLPKDYAWLYRHDREFLWAQYGRLERAARAPKHNDLMWKERDRLAHYRIERVVRALRTNREYSTRLPVSTICRYAGVEKIVDKHLNRLPKTSALLEAIESRSS